MASLVQEVLVAIIVAGCAIFSAWRLTSPRLRLRTLELVGPMVTSLGAGNIIARLRTRAIGQLGAGCGSCSHNKTVAHHFDANRR